MRVRDIRGYTEGMDREEKGSEEEGKAREVGILNCIKSSIGKKDHSY